MNEDQIEGTIKKVVGSAQEAIGDIAANDKLEAKGLLNQATGAVQDGYGKVREKVRDLKVGEKVRGLIDEAPTTARGAVDTGRDLYQRGAAAVTRTAGDNTALAILAAGVAGAALSWFLWSNSKTPAATAKSTPKAVAKPRAKAAAKPRAKPAAKPAATGKAKPEA